MLPPGALHLASSEASPVQAFRLGEQAYGFQFHLEANSSLIDRWLTVAVNQARLEEEAGRVDPAGIRRQCGESIEVLEALSRETFSRWIERFKISPRRLHLPSR